MDNSILEIIINLINNVGFPIAACVYFAWQNEKLRHTLDCNTEAIRDLKDVIIDSSK